MAPPVARASSWAAALPILASPSPVSPDAEGAIAFDFNTHVVRFTSKSGVCKQLATLEPSEPRKSMVHFCGKIHGEAFEIQISRHWLSGNTSIIACHRPSHQTVTMKPWAKEAFDFWPGLRIQRRPSGPYAFWRKNDDPRDDDWSLNGALILSYDPEYEALGQILAAVLLWVIDSQSGAD
jgi:hypothetical protein